MAPKKKTNKVRLFRLLPVLTVIIALFCVIILKAVDLTKQNKVYAAKMAELEAELADEEERTNEIDEYRIYVTTDEYKREILREKFNYADKNEIVFRFGK